jgi:hypothetical protein
MQTIIPVMLTTPHRAVAGTVESDLVDLKTKIRTRAALALR